MEKFLCATLLQSEKQLVIKSSKCINPMSEIPERYVHIYKFVSQLADQLTNLSDQSCQAVRGLMTLSRTYISNSIQFKVMFLKKKVRPMV